MVFKYVFYAIITTKLIIKSEPTMSTLDEIKSVAKFTLEFKRELSQNAGEEEGR